jgi:hypothetical protein
MPGPEQVFQTPIMKLLGLSFSKTTLKFSRREKW